MERFCLVFCCRPCQGAGKGERIKALMSKGGDKVQKILDYKTLIKNHYQLQNFLRTQMTEKQRKLMAIQRRTLVLEDVDSDEEVDIGHYMKDFLDGKYDEDLQLSYKLKAGVFDTKMGSTFPSQQEPNEESYVALNSQAL